jgi:hypothetical protein
MFSIAFSSLFGQDAVHRCTAHAEGVDNRARRFAAGMHPPRQRRLRLAEARISPRSVRRAAGTRSAC